MGFSRQEYWSVLPHHSDPGIEPASPALQVDSLPTKLPGTRDTAWLLTLFLLFPFQRENRRLSVNALTEAHLPHVSRNTNRRLVLSAQQPKAHLFLASCKWLAWHPSVSRLTYLNVQQCFSEIALVPSVNYKSALAKITARA